MTKRKLADILWDAANKFLSPATYEIDGRCEFSCEAVGEALGDGAMDDFDKWESFLAGPVGVFLRSLGCPTGSGSALREFSGGTRQGVRYMWLLLAMHVAEDEGIEV